jgi:hypothetical protein
MAAASNWQWKANDAESKLAIERATIASQREEYAALVSSVQGSAGKRLVSGSVFSHSCLFHCRVLMTCNLQVSLELKERRMKFPPLSAWGP